MIKEWKPDYVMQFFIYSVDVKRTQLNAIVIIIIEINIFMIKDWL